MRLNYQLGYYKQKFGRDPKQWDLEDLFSLWQRVRNRYILRNGVYWDLIKEAREKVGEDVFYYHLTKPGEKQLRKYVIRYDNCKKHLSIGHSSVLQDRDDKLAFCIADETNFEYGQRIYELKKLTSRRFEILVYEVLLMNLNKVLSSKFKELDINPPDSFTIILGGREWIISHGSQNFYISSEKKLIEI